jgi:hypothetical protein
MSNKTQLQTNNTALDALITRVNAAKDVAPSLPDVGGGGSGDETPAFLVEFIYSDPPGVVEAPTVYYTDENMQPQTVTVSNNLTITVAANTIIAMTRWGSTHKTLYGGCVQLFYDYRYAAYNCLADEIFELQAS